ncbi:MAG TPA: nucleotide exchange factor GrpE [Acidobacteriota bacterium]|nr:nucleotide exchange factor GrpE [Acidobacteriota bacterium]
MSEEDKFDEESSDSISSKGNGQDDEDIEIEVLDPGEPTPATLESGEEVLEEIRSLESRLQELEKEKAELQDRLLRKHADFDNYRKRTEKDKQEFKRFALSDFMSELILILDNFERALAHSEEQSGQEYRKGVELIYRQLRDLMEKKGVKAIQVEGEQFDPNYHEAIARELRNDLPDNTILEELQKGYLLHNKLLRPAMVKVSFRTDGDEEQSGDDELEVKTSADEEGWEKTEL